MSVAKMGDYVATISTANTDYTATTLNVNPTRIVPEAGLKHQRVFLADDTSEKVITYSSTSQFTVELQWSRISDADAGTIFDFFHDTNKANGYAKSFWWPHPLDGYTYTVKFRSPLTRGYVKGTGQSVDIVKLKVLGRKSTA